MVATPSGSFAAAVSSQAATAVPTHGVASVQSFVPFGYAYPPGVQLHVVPGVSGVVPISTPLSLPPAGFSGQTSATMGVQPAPLSSVLMQFPPPSMAQSVCFVTSRSRL